MKRVFLGAISAAFSLAACGGGGGSSPAGSAVVATPTPSPVPTAKPTATPVSQYRNTATLKLRFTPTVRAGKSASLQPQYVSPGANSLTVTVNTVDGAAPPAWVSPNPDVISLDSSVCTTPSMANPTVVCTVTVPAPPGQVNYTFAAFLSGAKPKLLAENTQTVTIAEATAVSISTTLRGVVSTVDFTVPTLAASTTTPGTSSTQDVTYQALDADGYVIVNGSDAAPFDSPITVTDNDTSGQTMLSVNGGVAASSVTLQNPTDTLAITYTGEGIDPFGVSASGANAGGAPDITGSQTVPTSLNPFTFTGLVTDTSADGNIDNGSPTLFFSQPSGTLDAGVSELGWTNAPYDKSTSISLDPTTCGTGASAIASAGTVTTANQFPIDALAVGVCRVSVTDGLAAHTTSPGIFYVSITGGSIGVNARGRK